jgi:hypothetical protein
VLCSKNALIGISKPQRKNIVRAGKGAGHDSCEALGAFLSRRNGGTRVLGSSTCGRLDAWSGAFPESVNSAQRITGRRTLFGDPSPKKNESLSLSGAISPACGLCSAHPAQGVLLQGILSASVANCLRQISPTYSSFN